MKLPELKFTKRSTVLILLCVLFLCVYGVIEDGASEVQVQSVIGAESLRHQTDGDKAHILTRGTDANT